MIYVVWNVSDGMKKGEEAGKDSPEKLTPDR